MDLMGKEGCYGKKLSGEYLVDDNRIVGEDSNMELYSR